MAKPGGSPIVKERPFFVDKNFAIFAYKTQEGKIVHFKIAFFKEDGKTVKEEKKFLVIKHNVLEAWQQLEKYADPIIEKIIREEIKRRSQKANKPLSRPTARR